MLGGAAGMMAVAQTVALITRKIDLLALAVLLLLFLVSLACRVILDRLDQKTPALATFVFAGFCLVPAVAAVAVMLARKGFSLPL
ncbi:MAG: hypothetical protein E5X96_14020 [Mesorhizobium sp.]|nr:MAG: hypothetical protein E5X96_14020 [Mesorhizobium sp.]